MRPRLRPAVLFDLGLGVIFILVALAAFVAEGRPSAIVATAHTVANRIGWRESYETGLLIGLGIVAGGLLAIAGVVAALRHRARPAPEVH